MPSSDRDPQCWTSYLRDLEQAVGANDLPRTNSLLAVLPAAFDEAVRETGADLAAQRTLLAGTVELLNRLRVILLLTRENLRLRMLNLKQRRAYLPPPCQP